MLREPGSLLRGRWVGHCAERIARRGRQLDRDDTVDAVRAQSRVDENASLAVASG
jgi:hypothetical protein